MQQRVFIADLIACSLLAHCLLNMFRAPLCPSSGAQDYYTLVAACGIWCCVLHVVSLVLVNMFRAARCSSSGGPIVSPQPLVSSPSVSGRTVCRWKADCSPLSTCILYGCLQTVTIPEAVVMQFVLLMMSSVLLETC